MLAAEEGLSGESVVRLVGCGDDHELNGRVGEGLFNCAEDADAGPGLCGFVAAALDDGVEFEARDCVDEGGMEDAACEAEADDCGWNLWHGTFRRHRRLHHVLPCVFASCCK